MQAKAIGLLAGGLVLTVLGLVWGEWFPINKPLWTSSYVLLTGGLGAYALGLTYWVVDVRGLRGWTAPFTVFGTNAILVYVGSGILADTLLVIKLAGPDGLPVSLYSYLHSLLFASWLGTLRRFARLRPRHGRGLVPGCPRAPQETDLPQGLNVR